MPSFSNVAVGYWVRYGALACSLNSVALGKLGIYPRTYRATRQQAFVLPGGGRGGREHVFGEGVQVKR